MSSKQVDENKFWVWEDKDLSLEGVFPYRGSFIKLPNVDPNKLYNVYRPASELQKAAETFNALPFFEKHQMVGKDAGFLPADQKPAQGVVYNTKFIGDKIVGTIKVFSEKLKSIIDSGIKGLSLGYTCNYVPQKGVFKGIPYDFVQTNMVGNHLALVPRGRMGDGVALDETEKFDFALSYALDEVDFETKPLKEGKDMSDNKDKDKEQIAKDEFVSVEKLYEKFPEHKEWIDKMKYKRNSTEDEVEITKTKESRTGFKTNGAKDEAEPKDDDKKSKAEDADTDKRKLIDEVGGILKGKVSDEIIRTVMKKMEEASYNKSSAGTANDEDDDKKKDEDKKKDGEDEDDDKKKDKGCGMDEAEMIQSITQKIKSDFRATRELAKKAKPTFSGIAYDEYDTPEALAIEICKNAGLPTDNAVVRAECYLEGLSKSAKVRTYSFDQSDASNDIAQKTKSFLSGLNK